MDSENQALTWAREYLRLGMHPIPADGKKASGKWKRYQEQAPTEDDLERWFLHPGHNVALVLGRGLIAIDLDGPGAEEALAERLGQPLPEDAPRSRTSNGHHVLLRVSGPVENRVGMLASSQKRPGTDKPLWQVDVRADGGYIVAPPSVHPDTQRPYEWVRRPGPNIPDAPQALLELVKARGKASGAHKDAPGAPEAPRWVSQGLQGVGEGRRDDVCAKLAGYFLGKGHPPDVVKTLLYAYGERCKPPFPRAEVDKTVDSVTRKDGARAQAAEEDQDREFQVLGHDHGAYFYLPRGSQQVVELRADQHTKLHLLRLAPLQYWEQNYAQRNGVQFDMAANALIRKCEEAGVYDVSRVRGRGAWWEGDRAVLHLGDVLVSGDQRVPVASARHGQYVYESASPIPIDVDDPLDVDSANRVAEICALMPWEKAISGRLLAGWAVVAPVCGALAWRPHVWLTGGAGTGKSWILDKVLRPVLGDIGLSVQSETTEAGLRQTLGQDARPVTFDEIEGEDLRAQQRVQNVLALARQASSEGGAVIVKGSASGAARTYRIRSCFAFSSIGVSVQHFADATRVSVLSLERRDDPAAFARLQEMVADTLTPTFAQRWVARSVRLVPAIRSNAETFALAGAAHLGSRRLGDQLGALLAGAYSLFDEGLVSPADARAWVAQQDWDEQRAVAEQSDEQACLHRILEHVLRVETFRGPTQRSVAELARVAAGQAANGEAVAAHDARDVLGRAGLRVDVRAQDLGVLTISTSHSGVGEILSKTKWATGWARALRRLPGARVSEGSVRFGDTRSRGVEIPLEEAVG